MARGPIAQLRRLYAGYPEPDGVCDFTVRLEAERFWRRWLRPSVAIRGDYVLPDAAPLPLAQGLLAAEMGMNLQMALGQKSFLLLHAASVERDGRALLMTGHSGAGKSTLGALLGERGWRFMGDEFALLDLDDGTSPSLPARGQPQERVARPVRRRRSRPARSGAERHAQGQDPPPSSRTTRRWRGWASRRGRS